MTDLPPHFPDPSANPIAVLEAHNAELTEALADAFKEAKAWQAQLETALERTAKLERAVKAWEDYANRDVPLVARIELSKDFT